ncbi:hypothetical protein F8O01_04645 [Pseudoclavibacter chungangensis]|uniref:ATP/GTP-binding protein n=1 Tax=Pseudoclavibacter chungangensis TaxID=587635 RepID=A0A7J5BYZ5_9MICO|nr:hypothetical protein [Pseudoclavibacter chungangensis]KAB1659563.1 hypothetical protein F8O01_04645 [Pseudoclavibacter chungangensis]NYJ67381.1 hypothetical protein [Pseudoclavibacter chungangensis]
MPRSNRPRRKGHGGRADDQDERGLERLRDGWRRTEVRSGVSWTVQPISAERATKPYTCPGCGGTVQPRTAHLVAWRAEGILGDDRALADRRHWHTHCWRTS